MTRQPNSEPLPWYRRLRVGIEVGPTGANDQDAIYMAKASGKEIVANLVRRRVDPASAAEMIEALGLHAHPLDLELAIDGGALIAQTRSKGLSHGDRACLSLARKLGLPALTADRVCADVADAIGVEAIVIR